MHNLLKSLKCKKITMRVKTNSSFPYFQRALNLSMKKQKIGKSKRIKKSLMKSWVRFEQILNNRINKKDLIKMSNLKMIGRNITVSLLGLVTATLYSQIIVRSKGLPYKTYKQEGQYISKHQLQVIEARPWARLTLYKTFKSRLWLHLMKTNQLAQLWESLRLSSIGFRGAD